MNSVAAFVAHVNRKSNTDDSCFLRYFITFLATVTYTGFAMKRLQSAWYGDERRPGRQSNAIYSSSKVQRAYNSRHPATNHHRPPLPSNYSLTAGRHSQLRPGLAAARSCEADRQTDDEMSLPRQQIAKSPTRSALSDRKLADSRFQFR